MPTTSRTDEDLLAARDATSFELFYLHHVDTLLGFFARRTGDPELAADLTSETFAAALAGRRRYKPEAGAAGAWLFGMRLATRHTRWRMPELLDAVSPRHAG